MFGSRVAIVAFVAHSCQLAWSNLIFKTWQTPNERLTESTTFHCLDLAGHEAMNRCCMYKTKMKTWLSFTTGQASSV